MNVEQLESPDGVVLRSSPTPEEWFRAKTRLALAAAACLVVGGAISAFELRAGMQLLLLEILPFLVGLAWALRFARTFMRARPTAVVATDHSLRLERLDGSRKEDLDLSGVASIKIGPDGFSLPWRWLKGPRNGLVVLRLRSNGNGLAIPAQLASHPVGLQLLARVLAASRAHGPVSLAGPSEMVGELERLALSAKIAAVAAEIPPITIPAGWYPDPAGGQGTRWWDGRAWTDHVREATPG